MPEVKKEWKRLAPSLIAMGILTGHDMEAFAGYCQAYARWSEAGAIFLKQLPLCAFCQAEGTIVPATVVDHIIPHRGDQRLFWDQTN